MYYTVCNVISVLLWMDRVENNCTIFDLYKAKCQLTSTGINPTATM